METGYPGAVSPGSPDWDIYSTCVSGPVSTWIYAVCGCSVCVWWWWGERGEHVLLQGLILGLGALAGMEVSKSKQGAIWGNTAAERLLGAASAKQSAVRPGETRGFPTPLSVTFTAAVGGGGRQGKWIPPTQSPRGSGFPFLAALAQS